MRSRNIASKYVSSTAILKGAVVNYCGYCSGGGEKPINAFTRGQNQLYKY